MAAQALMGLPTSTSGTSLAAAWRYGLLPTPDGTSHADLRAAQYRLGWECYANTLFEEWALSLGYSGGHLQAQASRNLSTWAIYKRERGLYARTMPLYNPTRRLVDFYASHVFAGVLSEDGAALPDGMALAIPLSKDTPEPLRAAIAQGWWWGNWQNQKALWIRLCAATGDGPLEIIDDVEDGSVTAEPVWPGEITHLERNGRGNVTAYTRQQPRRDDDGKPYIFARVVTPERIATFRDGQPWAEDGGETEFDNPYGFAPLVWNSHVNIKSIPGGQAIRNWNKVEKLNSLSSRLHRYVERQARTPMLLPDQTNVQAVKLSADMEEEIQLLTSEGKGVPVPISGNMDIAAVEAILARMITEVEHDHPEVTMYSSLRSMSTITGPAAQALMGDVAGYLNDARSGYDQNEIRKNQMIVAIGGMRYREGKGGWAVRNSQQRKFASFGLDSYWRGDLDHSIDARPLIPETAAQMAATKTAQAQAYKAMEDAGQPLDFQLGPWGENWGEKQLGDLRKAQDEKRSKAQVLVPELGGTGQSASTLGGTE